MNVLTTIIVLIVMLGILISSHEAGHLAVAKAFNVYCLEYSIGFGPKIFSRKRRGGETEFAIRAFPLGGYVSMYGEGVELPQGVQVPESRSLSGVSPWKRSLILSAGIAVNLFLSLLFVMIYATCFPNYYATSYFDTGYDVAGNVLATEDVSGARAYAFWIKGSIGDYVIDEDKDRLYSPTIATDEEGNEVGWIIDCDALVDGRDYVALYVYESIDKDSDILSGLTLYEPKAGFYPTAVEQKLGLTAYPDISAGAFAPTVSSTLTLHLGIIKTDGRTAKPTRSQFASFLSAPDSVKNLTAAGSASGSEIVWSSASDVATTSLTYWPPFGERLVSGARYFVYFFQQIGLGLASLFMGNFANLGSVVAMGSVIGQSSAFMGVGRTFFVYGGFLSLNLAIFNLLPFPGLDGWQLFVTFVEGVFRKKIPEKVKNAVSFIGLALLMILSVFLIVKDTFSLLK